MREVLGRPFFWEMGSALIPPRRAPAAVAAYIAAGDNVDNCTIFISFGQLHAEQSCDHHDSGGHSFRATPSGDQPKFIQKITLKFIIFKRKQQFTLFSLCSFQQTDLIIVFPCNL